MPNRGKNSKWTNKRNQEKGEYYCKTASCMVRCFYLYSIFSLVVLGKIISYC